MSDAEVVQVLQGAMQGNPAATQRMIQLESTPEYYSCLGRLLADPTADEGLRQISALQIKKNLNNPACSSNTSIQQGIMSAIGDANSNIRKAMAIAIARGISSGAWPLSAIDYLINSLSTNQNPSNVSGCVRALTYVVEEMIEPLDVSGKAGTLVGLIVPLIVSTDASVRELALTATSVFIEQAGIRLDGSCYAALAAVIGVVITSCLSLLRGEAGEISSESQVQCVKILVLSLTFTDHVMPHFDTLAKIMNYVVKTLPDETIRIEALSFWKAVLYFPAAAEAAKAYMNEVIPMILECMVYSPMELNMLGGQVGDWQVEDKPEDIKPRHFQGRGRNFHHDDEDEDGQQDDVDTDWNLRRSAASTIDDISQRYGDAILELALQRINHMMQPDQPWASQEAAILAIGALCEGCYDGLKQYMGVIIKRLLDIARDDNYHHLARQICCWTIGQMNEFLLERENTALLHDNVNVVLALMKSPTKSVQEAATAALQRILESAYNSSDNYQCLQVDDFMRQIVETCSACLENYQLKNRQVLLECIESVCQYYGTDLTAGDTFTLLMTPLGRLWGATPDDSPLIFAYFECMASVCSAFGRAIESYAPSIFDRTVAMIITHTNLRYQAKQHDTDIPDEEYLITAIDLLSSLFDAMGASLEPLVSKQPNLMECILQSLRDESPDIAKAAFALVGDLSGACPAMVQQNLDTVCNLMLARIKHVDERRAGAASNVAWALTVLIEHQMAIANLPTLQPAHYDGFLHQFCGLLATTDFTTDMVNLAENICLCIGCILLIEPESIIRCRISLGYFASKWCEYVRNIKNVSIKDRALRGFLSVAQANPAELRGCYVPFMDVCTSVASDATSDMKQAIRALLQTLKTGDATAWSTALGKARKETSKKLHVAYGV